MTTTGRNRPEADIRVFVAPLRSGERNPQRATAHARSRAALIWPFITTMAPFLIASGDAATRMASKSTRTESRPSIGSCDGHGSENRSPSTTPRRRHPPRSRRSICLSSSRDVRSLPLLERKTLLEHVLGKCGQKRIFPATYGGLNGVALFDAADQAELEEIVAKRVDSPYRRGRSRDWLKLKTKHGRAIDEEQSSWNDR